MLLTPADRGEISGLQFLDTQHQHRDASAIPSSSKWKKPAVPIAVPTRNPRPTAHNPLGGRQINDLHAPRRGSGNPNTQPNRTILGAGRTDSQGPPSKRARTSFGKRGSDRKAPPPLAPEFSEEIICIDADEEDLGRPLGDPNHATSSKRCRSPSNDLAPGPSRLQSTSALDSDPIDSSPPTTQLQDIAVGTVSKRRRQYERRELPMSKVQTSKRPTIASGMKPNLQNAPNPFPPASSMSATARAKAKATSTLPIKKWSFGCELREGPYYLTWGNKQIEIKSGDPSKPSSHTTTLLFLDIDSVTVSEHSPKFEMVIRFETMKPLNGRQIPGDPNTFIQGETDGRGAITILLDNNSPSFPLSMATYEKFSALLKKDITECATVRGGGASLAIWNQTMQSVNLGSSALSPPTPSLDFRATRRSSPPLLAPENDPTPIEPPEESRRSSRQKQRKRPPTMDPDEVILVYPPETPGAVPITNADLARLDPGEFLNDTLIEFGLKLWLKELETENPELAKQIHIFNSFFYKKLNKKNLSEGYNDVKRWTAKIDIFEKKIIIIPINENLHWYLAVIYNPANMLVPPPPPIVIPSPATRSRVSTAGVSRKEPTPEPIPPSEDHPMDDNRMVVDGVSSPHSSENQVAKDLLFENPSSGIAIDSTAIHNSLSIMDLEDEDDELLLIAKSDHDATASERSAEAKSIPPTRFYGKNATSDKGGRQSPESQAMDMDVDVEEPVPFHREPPAYIFTLDSLGSRHPKVISVLQQYLMMEAEQRRHLSNTSKATGKTAPVPAQPNYCDCGVYLLHFAKTFAMNHERLCEYITLSTNKKNNSMEERCSKWDSGKLEGFRESLKGQLETLSKEWKALRAAKVEPKKPEEAPATPSADDAETAADSDSDIEIVEEKSAPRKSPKKSKAKTTAKPALRIR